MILVCGRTMSGSWDYVWILGWGDCDSKRKSRSVVKDSITEKGRLLALLHRKRRVFTLWFRFWDLFLTESDPIFANLSWQCLKLRIEARISKQQKLSTIHSLISSTIPHNFITIHPNSPHCHPTTNIQTVTTNLTLPQKHSKHSKLSLNLLMSPNSLHLTQNCFIVSHNLWSFPNFFSFFSDGNARTPNCFSMSSFSLSLKCFSTPKSWNTLHNPFIPTNGTGVSRECHGHWSLIHEPLMELRVENGQS